MQGGMHAVARALERVATDRGVTFDYDARVTAIRTDRGGVREVELADGRVLAARAVVCNADVAHLATDLLDARSAGAVRPAEPPSMSGWVGILRAAPREDRVAHEVVFPSEYLDEFVDIFDRDRPPADPTVYLCAQARAHDRARWSDAEPVFAMANAPAEPADGERPAETWDRLRVAVLERLRRTGRIAADDALLWERSPTDLARRFPGTRGSIYGASSNSTLAAFRRPANRIARIPGLYLASGSAHPGGGVPLCLLSGRAAAAALAADLGLPAGAAA